MKQYKLTAIQRESEMEEMKWEGQKETKGKEHRTRIYVVVREFTLFLSRESFFMEGEGTAHTK